MQFHLVLVHRADEDIPNLQRVVRENREWTHGLSAEHHREPVFAPLDVHEARRRVFARIRRVEAHRHLEFAPRRNLSAQRRDGEIWVLKVQVIRHQRLVQPARARGEFYSLGAEDGVLVVRILLPVASVSAARRRGSARRVSVLAVAQTAKRISEPRGRPQPRLLLQVGVRELFHLETHSLIAVVHHLERALGGLVNERREHLRLAGGQPDWELDALAAQTHDDWIHAVAHVHLHLALIHPARVGFEPEADLHALANLEHALDGGRREGLGCEETKVRRLPANVSHRSRRVRPRLRRSGLERQRVREIERGLVAAAAHGHDESFALGGDHEVQSVVFDVHGAEGHLERNLHPGRHLG